jgi:hypothetical protein
MNTKRNQNKLTTGVPHNAQLKEIVFSHLYGETEQYRLRFFVFDQRLKQGESYATNSTFTLSQIAQLLGGKSVDSKVQSKWQVELGVNARRPDLLTITSFKAKDFAFTPEFIAFQESWQGCKNGEPDTETKAAYRVNREVNEKKYAATVAARKNLEEGLKGKLPPDSYEFFFGCPYKELIAHIESTFQAGWTWSNRGKVWTLDHIKSLRDFDLLDPSEELVANHFTNLRACDRVENIRKHANSADLALAN